MNFNELNLQLNKDVNSFEFNGKTINVLKYLPIEDKNDLIYLTLQNSDEGGEYNLLKITMFFRLYITYLYTDIQFALEDKTDPDNLYNILESNGLFAEIIDHMETTEYEYLREVLDEVLANRAEYRNTLGTAITSFVEKLAPNAENALNILNNFNPEAFDNVMNFVKAINNGQIPQ
jgi:hypothetical protein